MKTPQKFGGNWTIEKLSILSGYLDVYLKALEKQPFRKVYIDAFAGSGMIETRTGVEQITGSMRIALQGKHRFDEYIFIEKNAEYAAALREIVSDEFAELESIVTIYNADCNDKLLELCDMDSNTAFWHRNRAVLFLDPYATEVKWATLEAISRTQAIDLWYLFPFSAAQRMLPNEGIEENWRNKLNELFGDTDWEKRFYKRSPQTSLLSEDDVVVKDVNRDELAAYICERLERIFPYVAPNPRFLYNTKNTPLFLFCFAVSNPNRKARDLAKKLAEDYILRKE
jgi:three-Cys-motif partner protein